MFWIALELSYPKIVLITRLSLTIENLTAFKTDGVTKFGNTVGTHEAPLQAGKKHEPGSPRTPFNYL